MKPGLHVSFAFVACACCPSAYVVSGVEVPVPLQRIDRDALCVTNGVVSALPGGRLAIDTPSSRAIVRIATTQSAEIRFRYLGPTETSKPLASGELRRQIGLKLRAQNTCNLLYAMWHIEPDSRIAVAIKRNPDKHTHAQCGANGYANIKPWMAVDLPRVLPGEFHTFRAELRGGEVTLIADGRVVWKGSVGNRILEFDGPVGFRTDNARFEFEYFAGVAAPGVQAKTPDESVNRCQDSPGD